MARFFSIILLILVLVTAPAESRVLSGSRTERKLNRKIERLLNSARKQYDSGKVQQALDSYWKILEIDPQETFAYLELGEIYFELKIYDRAIELLEPGCKTAELEMDPETVCHYYCVLTNAYVQIKQLGKASKALIKAADASPKNPLPRKILGDIYLANNRVKSAYKAYKKALSFDPNYEPALEKIGELTTKYNIQVSKNPLKEKKAPQSASKKPESARPLPINQPVPEPEQTGPAAESGNDDLIPVAIIPMPKSAAATPVETAKPAAPAPAEPVATPRPRPNTSPKPSVAAAPVPLPLPVPATASGSAATSGEKVEVDPAVVEEQLDKLLAGSVSEKKDATDFFVGMNADGIVEVEELLYDSDPEVRIVAIRALSAFKAHKERVVKILQDSSDDPDPQVQKEIQGALSVLK